MRTWITLIGLWTVVVVALTGTPSAPRGQVSSASTNEDLVEGLRPEKGRELVLENCVLCHSTAIIVSNHMSRERWDEAITWMQDEHNLWPLETNDRTLILDYLEATQGEAALDDDQFDVRSNPWAWPLYRPNPIW